MKQDHDTSAARRARPYLEGKSLLAAHIDKDVHRAFRILAAEQGASNSAMLHKALARLFESYGKPVPRGVRRKLHESGLD